MIGGQYAPASLIYDVTNPVHPILLCRISNTSAHFAGGTVVAYLDPRSADRTNIVYRQLEDGTESPGGVIADWTTRAAWLPTGSVSVYTTGLPPSTQNPAGATQVWQYLGGTSLLVFTYRHGIGGCVCRFGIPQPVLAVSPDGQYLVAGWAVGKGSEPLAVYRLSDRARVTALDGAVTAFWDIHDHRLFVLSLTKDAPVSWTPEQGFSALPGAAPWSYMAGLSPDGHQVAYTAFADPNSTQLRVFVYDVGTHRTRMLVDRLRTQALFVRNGWVWYLDEGPCDQHTCGPIGTLPTGKVFALQLSTGTETEVVFAAGANPVMSNTGVNWPAFTPGEFWPAS